MEVVRTFQLLIHGKFFKKNSSNKKNSYRQLELPQYESKDKFYEKLILAISEGKEGFYIA